MPTRADDTPKRLDVLIISDDAEMPSLLNPLSGQIFLTNKVGKHVMQLADGRLKAHEIVGQITRRYTGASPDVIENEVLAFLDDSATKGLITWIAA